MQFWKAWKINFQNNTFMEIFEDLKVYLPPNLDPFKSIEYTNGVEKVTNINNVECLFDCFIPKREWQTLNNTFANSLITKSRELDYLNVIGVVNVPKCAISAFEMLGVSNALTMEDIRILKQQPIYQNGKDDFMRFLENYFLSTEFHFYHSIFVSNKNMECVTFDFSAKCYTGLHIDNFDRLDFSKKNLSRNRFCVNLGKEPRYFLFINLGTDKILQKLEENGFSLDEYISTKRNPVEDFFNLFPNYPVFRIKLLPNQAYIAPTELIIHDGSSIGQTTSDVTLTVRGFFHYCDPKEQPHTT